MPCQESRALISELPPGEALPEGLSAHLETCPECRKALAFQARLDAGARDAFRGSPLPDSRLGEVLARLPHRRSAWPPGWAWTGAAAAALLLLCAGAWRLGQEPVPPDPVREASVPVLPGGGRVETARDGARWLEAGAEPLRLSGPDLLLAPGTEAEIRSLVNPATSLLREACAAEDFPWQVSVVSGEVSAGATRLGAGRKARLGPSGFSDPAPLQEADLARIDGWRTERLRSAASRAVCKEARIGAGESLTLEDPGSPRLLSVLVKAAGSHLRLRYPAAGGGGAAILGNLPAWKDGGWHRLEVRASEAAVEVFLDGRRALKTPAARSGPAGLALEALGGPIEVRDLRTGTERDGA